MVGGGSVLRIQCRVLIAEFSKIDDAGWGGLSGGGIPPPDMGSSDDVTRTVMSP